MLVLTRKSGEGITLTDKRTGEVLAKVSVIFTRPGEAQLGFEAPPHVHILRDEVAARDAAQAKGKP